MQVLLKCRSTYSANKNGDLFLMEDSLIRLNNIITGSRHIRLRDVNVKPAGYSKIYLTKSLAEAALYRIVDQFNCRIKSHKDFCRIFIDQIHPLQDENCRTCKILFVGQKKKTKKKNNCFCQSFNYGL